MKEQNIEKWRNSWLSKKDKTKRRRIDFLFTLRDYAWLMENRKNLKCAYSGVKINMSSPEHPHYPQIDRVDQYKGYTRDNCIVVCNEAHRWKTRFVENKESLKGQNDRVISIVHRINKTLNSESGMEEMMKPYKGLWKQLDNQMKQTKDQKKKAALKEKSKLVQQERLITEMYHTYASEVQQAGAELLLTFAEFKRKINVKTCGLTKETLPVDLVQRKLYIIDKTKPITKENTVATTKTLSVALDQFQASCGLTATSLKRLGKGLSK